MNAKLLFSLLAVAAQSALGQIHVAVSGNDTNAGDATAPYQTIHKAVEVCQPGDTIWVHGGHYLISERIKIPAKQTSALKRCYLWAVPGEGEVIIDGSAMHHTTQNEFKMGRCIYVNHLANYWHFKGLTLCNAEDNGMKIEGSYNIVEQCVFHDNNDTGLQIGMYKDFSIEETKELPAGVPQFNPGYQFCCGNKVINCDSYNNCDLRSYNGTDDGGDADGFACKLFPGPGTEFIGCRAWTNSDDNWDLYMVYHPVVIDGCWSYHAGYTPEGLAIGNGNGFKLGGGGSSGGAAFSQSVGAHVVKNCVAFDNLHKGFDQNNAYEGMYVLNCVGWGNEYNYRFPTIFQYGGMYIRNCIGFNATRLNHEFLSEDKEGSVVPNTDYNSWTTLDGCNPYKEGQKVGSVKPMTKDYSDQFVSLAVADFMAPREADGSLPRNGFARLKEGSLFKDQGQPIVQFEPSRFMSEEEARQGGLDLITADFITIPYNDAAPDFGAYELDGDAADIDDTPVVKAVLECVSGNASQEVVRGMAIERIEYIAEHGTFTIEDLPAGLYYTTALTTTDDGTECTTILINGIPEASGTFTLTVTGERNTVHRSGTITVVPPSHILAGDWYHLQDDINALPAEYRDVLSLVQGSDASHPSRIDPAYTESGTVPGGCTQGAVVMGRNGGGIQWNLPMGVMKLLVNLHFTGGRAFKITWTLADGTSGSFTTPKLDKGTYTSWDVLGTAGLGMIEQGAVITLTNQNSSGEVRLYDMLVRVLDGTSGIETIRTVTHTPTYDLQGRKSSSHGYVIHNGKLSFIK